MYGKPLVTHFTENVQACTGYASCNATSNCTSNCKQICKGSMQIILMIMTINSVMRTLQWICIFPVFFKIEPVVGLPRRLRHLGWAHIFSSNPYPSRWRSRWATTGSKNRALQITIFNYDETCFSMEFSFITPALLPKIP